MCQGRQLLFITEAPNSHHQYCVNSHYEERPPERYHIIYHPLNRTEFGLVIIFLDVQGLLYIVYANNDPETHEQNQKGIEGSNQVQLSSGTPSGIHVLP